MPLPPLHVPAFSAPPVFRADDPEQRATQAIEAYVRETLYAERRAYIRRIGLVLSHAERVSDHRDWERACASWEALVARRDPDDGVLRWDHRVRDAQALRALVAAADRLAAAGVRIATRMRAGADRQRRGVWGVVASMRIAESRRAAGAARDMYAHAQAVNRAAQAMALRASSLTASAPSELPGHALLVTEARLAVRAQMTAVALAYEHPAPRGVDALSWRRAVRQAAALRARAGFADPERTECSWRSVGTWVERRRMRGDREIAAYVRLCDDPRRAEAVPRPGVGVSVREGLFAPRRRPLLPRTGRS